MRYGVIGLAILAALACSVNLQAQSAQSTSATTRASLLGGSAALPPQPGPPPNASAEFLIAEGNALLAAGYIEAALQDFQKAINLAPDSSPTVSKGWLGLAKGYMAKGNTELAKTCMEEVLSRNNDPDSVAAARSSYLELKSRADLALSQAQQAVMYFQWRYHSTPFFSFITKFFAWRDLKNAEKQLAQAQQLSDGFNPRYLIPPVGSGGGARASETYSLTPAELERLLQRIPTEGSVGAGTVVTGVHTPAPSETAAASVPAPAPAVATTPDPRASTTGGNSTQPTATVAATQPSSTAAPADDLKAKREAYLTAYKNLQAAVGAKDNAAIQAATKAFQEAMKAYEAARRRAESAQ
ncbi:MAG: tetratricopeptide repeat protein [Candidatus Wallbacteria bacterium]|nr:tetratricopeptide repeat protein [Candidatus Wallbacteria bacterium]